MVGKKGEEGIISSVEKLYQKEIQPEQLSGWDIEN